MSKVHDHLIIGHFIVPENVEVVGKSTHAHWMSMLRFLLSLLLQLEKMAMQSTLIAVYLHVIHHLNINDLCACVYVIIIFLKRPKAFNLSSHDI